MVPIPPVRVLPNSVDFVESSVITDFESLVLEVVPGEDRLSERTLECQNSTCPFRLLLRRRRRGK